MALEIEQGPDGLFAVCVFGAESSSDNELQEIFQKFGEVANIRRTQSNNVFIRYGSLDEAVACYESMKDDAIFRVRPAKTNKNLRNKDNFDNNFQRSEAMNRKNNSGDFQGRRNDGGDFNRRNEEKTYNRKDFAGAPNNRSEANGNARPMPKLVHGVPVPAEDKNKPPPPSCKIAVIANLPPKTKHSNIYDLCKRTKANPVRVATKEMLCPPYPPVLYACVLCKNDEDVKNIVEGLANLKMNGYTLIVDEAGKMVEEAAMLP